MVLGIKLTLFIFFAKTSLATSMSCYKHLCYDDKQAQFDDTTCIYIDAIVNPEVWYHRSCKTPGTECLPSFTSQWNYTCQESPQPVRQPIYAGQKCDQNTACISGFCNSDGICTGKGANETCTDHLDCDVGLRCDLATGSPTINTCVPQLIGDSRGCMSDYDCQNSYGCMRYSFYPSYNQCVRYYSLQKGTEIPESICVDNESSLCQYTYCAKNEASQKYYCTEKIELYQQTTKCSSPEQPSNECVSNFDQYSGRNFHSKCQCGLNSEGQAYCSPFLGNDLGEDMQEKLLEWISSRENQNHCNTARRNSMHCAKNWFGDAFYGEWNYYSIKLIFFPWSVDIESCVYDTYWTAYRDAKEFYEDHKSAVTLLAAGGLALFF